MAFDSSSESGWRISRRSIAFRGSSSGTHKIYDPKGNTAGYIHVTKLGKGKNKELFINNVYAYSGPGSVGYSGVRDIARQLRRYYKAKVISFSGNRTSGAREKLGGSKRMTSIRFSGQDVSILGVVSGKPGGHAGYGI